MKISSLILLLFFIVGCNNKNDIQIEKPKPFFEFDQVIHFQVNDEDEIWKSLQIPVKKKSTHEIEFKKVLMKYDYPVSINDTTFLISLKSLYPKVDTISQNFHQSLSKIFSQNKKAKIEVYACDAFFRDILIFKKNEKITGIAKICFECKLNSIVGAKVSVENFGANGEFESLKKIIRK